MAVIAGAAFSLAPASALAGQAEIDALLAALQAQAAGRNFTNATGDQIAQAFKSVVLNTALDPGIVAGEALRRNLALDTGDKIGLLVKTDSDPKISALLAVTGFVVNAAVTASTPDKSKMSFAGEVPDFVAALQLTRTQAEAAAVAAKLTPAIGSILAGFAESSSQLTAAFASEELNDARFKKALFDIPKYFAQESADSAVFTVGIVNLNVKNALKIIPGAIAGDPTNAGAIFAGLYADTNNTNPEALPALRKGAATLSKTAAPFADTEEIQKIGNVLGKQIAKGPTFVKLSAASGIVKNLVTAVMNKPPTDRFGLVTVRANTNDNKVDEIAEVVSYVIGGLAASPELAADATGAKGAAALFKLITTAVKVKPKALNGTLNGPNPDSFAADVAASVAYTIAQSPGVGGIPAAVQGAFKTLIQNPANIAKISKTASVQTAITSALTKIYNNDPNDDGMFENGNVSIANDPESDSHPFYGTLGVSQS
ncbi:MAG: hypothetical protein QOE70_2436 [Chthoniobacter sp.]|nr:hypothetical protein [Chthoniobacter sp.]